MQSWMIYFDMSHTCICHVMKPQHFAGIYNPHLPLTKEPGFQIHLGIPYQLALVSSPETKRHMKLTVS